jgi:hypothetical protein
MMATTTTTTTIDTDDTDSSRKRAKNIMKAFNSAIDSSLFSRVVSGQGYDWMEGQMLILSPLSSHTSLSYHERVMRMFIDIHNHHDCDRMEDFMASNASEDFLMTATFGHHPLAPTLDPLRFFYGAAGSGQSDFLHRYQSIVSLGSDSCFQLGNSQVKQTALQSFVWSCPVSFHATIVVKLPLTVALADLIGAGIDLTDANIHCIRQIFDQLGTYQSYCPLTLSSMLLPPNPVGSVPSDTLHSEMIEESDISFDPVISADENIVIETLYSSLLSQTIHDPNIVLQTCCIPVKVQGVLHAHFHDRQVVHLEFDYYEK